MILSVLYESLTISIGNQGKNEQNHFNYYSISRILHIRILATLCLEGVKGCGFAYLNAILLIEHSPNSWAA